MKTREKVLNIGDWVVIDTTPKMIGYITTVSLRSCQYEIQLVRTMKGRKLSGEYYIHFGEVTPFQIHIEEDDVYQMMNLAVDTKDKKWFNKLQELLPEKLLF